MPAKRRVSDAISDESTRARTGKGLAQWYALLDRWGAASKGHATTARYLLEDHGLSPWWSQSVTIAYERERGLRAVGQRSTRDFVVSLQRTVDTTPERAFAAWTNARHVSRWFTTKAKVEARPGGSYSNADGDRGTFTIVEPPRRLAFTWDNPDHCPGTRVEVLLTPKAGGRVSVRLDHSKLASQRHWTEMKQGWSWALDSLKSWLETGQPIPHEAWLAHGGARAPHAARGQAASARAPARRARTGRGRVGKAARSLDGS
jgi:uncharacterized protein YndB with AHSA1/START domain